MNHPEETKEIKLTQYSHGAGCGCKIAPAVLEKILKSDSASQDFPSLLVGNSSRDDAAAYDLGNGQALISTTDFFTPIVDDPYDFGRVASANAISDVYAMGGKPLLAIAILGWPVDKLPPEMAAKVLEGSREVCRQAGIPLAGGHSIDSTEPIFGLAVNGIADIKNLKKNNTAKEGDLLFLTKPLGIGVLSTAAKKGIIKDDDYKVLIDTMCTLNRIGEELGKEEAVTALTDVTGFGLLGHLIEMAQGSGLSAKINYKDVPLIPGLQHYTDQFCFPDSVYRNWNSFEPKVSGVNASFITMCDPQTSGGLLIAVAKNKTDKYLELVKKFNLPEFASKPVGEFTALSGKLVEVTE